MQQSVYGTNPKKNRGTMYFTKFNTQLSPIILVGDEFGLAHLHIDSPTGKRKFHIEEKWIENPSFFTETQNQILEYLSGNRNGFNIKLNPTGTKYQILVWKKLQNIPYGETRSYKEIAIQIGNPKASRAIGLANGKNKIPIIIPCHRVIGSNGQLTGFAHGLDIKLKLLEIEKPKS